MPAIHAKSMAAAIDAAPLPSHETQPPADVGRRGQMRTAPSDRLVLDPLHVGGV